LEAAESLAAEGYEIEVVDPRTLSPLDEDAILSSVKKTKRLIVVDEDNPRCSMATDLVSLVATSVFDHLDAPPQTVSAPHTPVPFAPVMEDFYIPTAERIAAAVRQTL
jgi:pyruvate/2-oxoglutarate/acetoin dehydrogenase E1 component